jgi:uncharacterized membrane protein
MMRGMSDWLGLAVGAALLYGLHQVFTKLAAPSIGDGAGGFIVEAAAAASIGLYLAVLWWTGRWDQPVSRAGVGWSVLTGLCVGAGTVLFFLMFQRGAPISVVPAVLAVGMGVMVVAGVLVFGEPVTWRRAAGLAMAVGALFLLRSPP